MAVLVAAADHERALQPEPGQLEGNDVERVIGVHEKLGAYPDALSNYRRSLEIKEELLGDDKFNIGGALQESIAATLNNIGPGLGTVGATQNYGHFSALSKLLFTMLMMIGRVEIFAILVLFTPRFWRSR